MPHDDTITITDGNPAQGDVGAPTSAGGLTLAQFEAFHKEVKEQPPWRTKADREADYLDGNQLDSEILRKQQSIGMPPAIEPLMGPALDYICGMEAKLRRNWRVIPNGENQDDDVAVALNVKLNEAERHSKADEACSEAFRGQAGLGVAWLEVSREPDPFKYKYRVPVVHRNEIWYDWKGSRDPSMPDHRYLIRRRWTDKTQAKLRFPAQADLIENAATNWSSFERFTQDGGRSTGLQMSTGAMMPAYGAVTTPLPGDTQISYPMLSTAYQSERGSSIEEQEWRDSQHNRVALFEVWYRVWDTVLVFKTPDGRAVEYDQNNEMHVAAVAMGSVVPEQAVVSKVRLSWWLGPHKLADMPCPYKHNRFPYVPFWNRREDRTGVPYGLARGWMYLQDTVNATLSKLRWGLSAVRTVRTDGAVADNDATFRREIARSDADIVLSKDFDPNKHVFKVERDFQLTEQQQNMLNDSREGIKRTGSLNSSFMSEGVDARSGLAHAGQMEMANMGHSSLVANFQNSRTEVGTLLLSLIIEDMSTEPTSVRVPGTVSQAPRVIDLNVPGENGTLTNDISRVLLRVDLEDVPASPSYRTQQLAAFSEVFKSTPDSYQRALFPHLLSLMDVPDRDQVIAAVRAASQQPTDAEIEQRIKDAVDEALTKAGHEVKVRKLEQEQVLADAKVDKLKAEAVAVGTTAAYEAMQAAGVVIAAPGAAAVADTIMHGAGYTPPAPEAASPGIEASPGVPAVPAGVPGAEGAAGVPAPAGNTHPNLPPHPASPALGVGAGIETPKLGD